MDEMDLLFGEVATLTRRHDLWRKMECINLIASENVMSPVAEELYLNDMAHRYAEGLPFKRYYQGHKYLDPAEVKTQEMFKRLFNADFVDLRPLSGTIANLSIYAAFLKPGDKVAAMDIPHGSHVSHTIHGALGIREVNQVFLPFDASVMNIDVDKAVKVIEEEKPKMVILGASLFLFPHPVKEISEAAKSINATVVYDAAHVLGLIAGKQFQRPFEEGADIVTSSTHKTFPGPQGGLIMAKEGVDFEKIQKGIFPKLVCNHHIHRIPALARTAWEMWRYGENYAKQTIKNAKVLAEKLCELGFKVLAEDLGFTQSHQVVVDVSNYGKAGELAKRLEENNIITNKNMIPGDYVSKEKMKEPSGIRIGTQEMTRWGCKERDMDVIAEFIKRVVVDKENVKEEVKAFRLNFQNVHYC